MPDFGWPDGPEPVVDEFQVAHVQGDNGEALALIRLTDALGNVREVRVSERAAWSAVVGFQHFLRQVHQPPASHYRQKG